MSNKRCESEHVTDVNSNNHDICIADGNLLDVHNTGIINYNVLSISLYIYYIIIYLITSVKT